MNEITNEPDNITIKGNVNEELLTNLPHYRKIIHSQGIDQDYKKINPFTVSSKADSPGTTIWSRIREFKSDSKYSNLEYKYHWKNEEKLISYFLVENDNPEEYIVYQQKKFNMITNKMMYLRMLIATPKVLRLYEITL